MTKNNIYSSEDLEESVKLYLNGMKLRDVLRKFTSIPERKLAYIPKKAVNKDDIQCPGPAPIRGDLDKDVESWIVDMKSQGYPVYMDMIFLK